MILGLSGTLLSHEALERLLRDDGSAFGDRGESRARCGRLRAWHLPLRYELGPVSAARTIFDRLAAPLFEELGYRVIPSGGATDLFRAVLEAGGMAAAGLVVTGWGRDGTTAWRDAVRHGIALDARWCFCVTGPALRIVDSRRTYSRRFIEFALDRTLDDEQSFRVFWSLLHAGATLPLRDGTSSFIDRAVAMSDRHRIEVRDALQGGVEEALVHLLKAFALATGGHRLRSAQPASTSPAHTFDEALVVIYRILFLLFAEARGLVPLWHPVFRDGYTIEALRDSVELLPRPRGLWETLQAMSRLAHRGCHVGPLKVPPFNGRLFSPGQSPLADSLPLADAVVRQAVLALTTRPVRGGRVRVSYGDLGVEQLGGIYERLLDVEPSPSPLPGAPALVRAETRKTSGSFYTPRSLTELVVRRTLAPLVEGAASDQILSLRVLDPAMGSGAFLVAACRYLASAYEGALRREGAFTSADITEPERVEFRRAVAQRCLFGVDLNPMAVQLGRLSLWLATMSADRPLTFLDHRLRVGNSLVGAGIHDLLRQPTRSGRPARPADLPLFEQDHLSGVLGGAVTVRSRIAREGDDTLAGVRAKEQALAELDGDGSVLLRWKVAADLWCAGWFRPPGSRREAARAFGVLTDAVFGRPPTLPAVTVERLLAEARAIARERRFFHWTLEYPEIFYRADGQPAESPGFDAILGNPPWEMLRGDRGTREARSGRRDDASRLTSFTRTSGVYRFQGAGHPNLYQLFLERSVSLLRNGGRLGLVLPSGFAVDQGSAALRRVMFDRTAIDGIVSIENREGMFPIHRGLRFLLVSATSGGRTEGLTCRFGIRSPDALDSMPEGDLGPESVRLPRALLERVSGPSLAVPELRTRRDVEIVGDLTFRWPALGDEAGWHVRFGRELNATDDRPHFFEAGAERQRGLPVIEGKHVAPFAVDLRGAVLRVRAAVAARLLNAPETFERSRLAYRDVAASTNRLSLIAAVVPAGVVTTHTLLCLKTRLDDESQQFLCGIFNSFVANYLIRPRITTHVGAGIIARLPVPRPRKDAPAFREFSALAASLARSASIPVAASLQAAAASLYGLTGDQFLHVLDSFPLVPEVQRRAAMHAFCDIVT